MFVTSARRHNGDVTFGEVIDVPGKQFGDELRGPTCPARLEFGDAATESAIELRWQGADQLVEECARVAVHPFAGKCLLAGERHYDGCMGTGAARLKNADRAFDADRTLAAHDLEQGLAMDAGLARNLMFWLVCAFNCIREDPRKARICLEGGLMHGDESEQGG